jgi:hypothetical protein
LPPARGARSRRSKALAASAWRRMVRAGQFQLVPDMMTASRNTA